MHTIYKYELKDNGEPLLLPERHRILSVQAQHGHPVLWALVDTDSPAKPFRFRLVMTGEPVTEHVWDMKYYGTLQLLGGGIIMHVFLEE